MSGSSDGFGYKPGRAPEAFIQWKGTDVCMDFQCECGENSHFDGDFAYAVKCPKCLTVWQMPWNLYPRKMTREMDAYWYDHAQPLQGEEDE